MNIILLILGIIIGLVYFIIGRIIVFLIDNDGSFERDTYLSYLTSILWPIFFVMIIVTLFGKFIDKIAKKIMEKLKLKKINI